MSSECPHPNGGVFTAAEDTGSIFVPGSKHRVQVDVQNRVITQQRPGILSQIFASCAVKATAVYGASAENGIIVGDNCRRCGNYVQCHAKRLAKL